MDYNVTHSFIVTTYIRHETVEQRCTHWALSLKKKTNPAQSRRYGGKHLYATLLLLSPTKRWYLKDPQPDFNDACKSRIEYSFCAVFFARGGGLKH